MSARSGCDWDSLLT